jgi:hypothetical protein
MFSNTIGNRNTAIGNAALGLNTASDDNTAIGAGALFSNTNGDQNTATGSAALANTTSGSVNTANGFQALSSNTEGDFNTATGALALQNNNTGSTNTATGLQALNHNTTGGTNVAVGAAALFNNTAGDDNTAIGFSALGNNTGTGNIALGSDAGIALTTGSNNIDIGNLGVAGENNTMRIGSGGQVNTFISGISGAIVPGGVAVIVGADGHLGTMVSSARFKNEIKPMDKASEVILALKPVTFHYKAEIDPKGIPQFGLVAEEVEKVNPDLVARDDQGKVYTVRYEAVNAMLLNEFLKEHRKVESLEKAMAEQQKDNAAMRAMLKEQAAQIQKVSAQLELSKPAAQTVKNSD